MGGWKRVETGGNVATYIRSRIKSCKTAKKYVCKRKRVYSGCITSRGRHGLAFLHSCFVLQVRDVQGKVITIHQEGIAHAIILDDLHVLSNVLSNYVEATWIRRLLFPASSLSPFCCLCCNSPVEKIPAIVARVRTHRPCHPFFPPLLRHGILFHLVCFIFESSNRSHAALFFFRSASHICAP